MPTPPPTSWRLICRVALGVAGDRIALPADEALEACVASAQTHGAVTLRLNSPTPHGNMLFGSVRDFSAPPRSAIVPEWMARALHVEDGGLVLVSLNTDKLEKATHVVLEPQTPSFFGLQDHKAILEMALSQQFATLSKATVVDVMHSGTLFTFNVAELEPADACSLLDTDVETDIRLPLLDDGKPRFVLPLPDAPTTAAPRPLSQSAHGSATGSDFAIYIVPVPPNEAARLEVRAVGGPAGQDFEVYVCDSTVPSPSPRNHQWTHSYSAEHGDYVGRAVICVALAAVVTTGALHVAVRAYGCRSCEFAISWVVDTPLSGVELPVAPMEAYSVCRNCHERMASERLPMHQLHCERHRVFCALCDKGILRSLLPTHWHCELCVDAVVVNSLEARAKHEDLFHAPRECPCGVALPIPELAVHTRLACPRRMVRCRFCQLSTPAGPPPSDPADIFLGFTQHESACGGRTDHCPQCHVLVRLRDMDSHCFTHEIVTVAAPAALVASIDGVTPSHPPSVCASLFCVRAADAVDTLGLCAVCRGALGGTATDSPVTSLATLVRFFLQRRTQGCGRVSCNNSANCATKDSSAAQALTAAVALARASLQDPRRLAVCEATQDQDLRVAADALCAMGFPLHLCVQGLLTTRGNGDAAAAWLLSHAPGAHAPSSLHT